MYLSKDRSSASFERIVDSASVKRESIGPLLDYLECFGGESGVFDDHRIHLQHATVPFAEGRCNTRK